MRSRTARLQTSAPRLASFALAVAASATVVDAVAAERHESPGPEPPSADGRPVRARPPPRRPSHRWPRPRLERVHNVHARLDLGRAHTYGVGYGLDWRWDRSASHPWIAWLSGGLDAALAGRDFPEATAWRGAAFFQVGYFGMGGMTLEIAAGPGKALDGGDLRWMGQVTALTGAYYFDFGYSYATPLDGASRPTWLSAHYFVLRVRIPVTSTRVRYLD